MADVIELPGAAGAKVTNPSRRGRLPRSVSTVQEKRRLRQSREQSPALGQAASTDIESEDTKNLVRVLARALWDAQLGKVTAVVWSARHADGSWASGATNVSNREAFAQTWKLAQRLAGG
jgi:hypothetical protein